MSDGRDTGAKARIAACLLIGLNLAYRVFLAGFFARYPVDARAPGSDESGYLNLARNLGSWLAHGNSCKGPVYPAFLKLCFALRLPDFAISLLQHGAILGALAFFLMTVLRPGQARLLWFALLCWYGPFITHPNGYMTETLTAAIHLIAIAGLYRAIHTGNARRIWISALIFSIGALIRSNFLVFFPVILLACTTLRIVRLRTAAIALLIFILPVGGWFARNLAIQGRPFFNSVGGEMIYFTTRRLVRDCDVRDTACYARVLGPEMPAAFSVPGDKLWIRMQYFDNTNLQLPVGAGYPWMNDLEAHQKYMAMARENLRFYLSHHPALLLNYGVAWVTNLLGTHEATLEYVAYRNNPDPLEVPGLVPLEKLARAFDLFFFGLAAFAWTAGIRSLVRRRLTDGARLLLVSGALLWLFPMLIDGTGRLTMIFVLLSAVLALALRDSTQTS